MRPRHLFVAIGLIASAAANAQTQAINFSGTITQTTYANGPAFPPGSTIPSSFTGSFTYNPDATTSSGYITNITVNFGAFTITKSGAAGAILVGSNSLEYADTTSLGEVGTPQLDMNEFFLTFANPSGGQPIDLSNIDFSSFQNDTLVFDMGQSTHTGEVHATGTFHIVTGP